MVVRGSIYDAFREPTDKRLRRLPSLIRGAVALVWGAARRELAVSAVLQVITGVGVGVQLLVGSRVLSTILTADRLDRDAGDVLPGLAILLGVTTVVGFAGRAQTELRLVIAELTGRHAQARVIDIATVVDLEAFERPDFHDRLQRATTAALFRPHSMTQDVITLLSLGVGVIGITAALAALQPLLLPIVLLAYVPLSVASSRNSRTRYRFGHRMTPNDRQRSYLANVLTGKVFAQELRAFGVAGFIRRRYDDLWDERVAELRRTTSERLRRSLAASVATSALSAASIGLLVWLLLTDRMEVAAAATAAVGIQQLGGRLSGIVASGSGLYEHSLFIEDFNSFLELAPAVAAGRPTGAAPEGFSVLTVEGLSFAYPETDRLALRDVSLSIRAGEVVAVVGENGSGKTTLAKLLCHLYTPTAGRILWDDVDTAGCDPAQLRRHTAVIFQDFVQYYLLAQENIGVGDHARADDLVAVMAAAVESGPTGSSAS
ncbi:MAG: ATP-binding cassette domain-containing protein, partial [Acidimicrobiales bacterium]